MGITYKLYAALVLDERWKFFVEGFITTLFLTISCFVLGSIIACLICYLRKSTKGLLHKTIELINKFFVQIPSLVLLMFFMYVVFQDISTSTVIICLIGLVLKNASYLSDIFISALDTVNQGEIEAARALGMTRFQAFLNVTFPQAAVNIKDLYANEFVTCLQQTSIVGSLAVTELSKASEIVTGRTLEAIVPLSIIAFAYILIGYVGKKIIYAINKEERLI